MANLSRKMVFVGLLILVCAPSATDVAAARSATAGGKTFWARTLCKRLHISPCTTRRVKLDGRQALVLARPVTLRMGPRGRLVVDSQPRAHAAYWSGEMDNLGSNLCLTTYGVGPAQDGADAHLWTCDPHAGDQSWGVEVQTAGYSLYGWLGMCLTNSGGRLTDNNLQTLWGCGASWKETYRFSAEEQNGNPFHFQADDSSLYPSGYCVTSDGNTTPGSDVEIWQCNGSSNQTWSGPLGTATGPQ